jgi:hypothetical protein
MNIKNRNGNNSFFWPLLEIKDFKLSFFFRLAQLSEEAKKAVRKTKFTRETKFPRCVAAKKNEVFRSAEKKRT